MTIELKKYERQNIKRRIGCNPIEYIQAYERQKGLCEMCQLPSKHYLKPDTFKKTKVLNLLCDFCLRLSELRKTNPQVLTERMKSYLELDEFNLLGR